LSLVIFSQNALNCIWKNSRELAVIQTAALLCLIKLLENYGSRVAANDWDTSELYRALLSSSEKSSFTPSVRGEMIHLLGLIGYTYKDDVLVRASQDQLLNYLRFIIKSQVSVISLKAECAMNTHRLENIVFQVESTHAKLEPLLLLGAIRAVDYFLRVFGKNYAQDLGSLHESLERIVNPSVSIAFESDATIVQHKKLTRRESQRGTFEEYFDYTNHNRCPPFFKYCPILAAFTLIAHHGNLFMKYLYEKHKQWFGDLLTWCRSSNTEDSIVGKTAMLAFHQVICGCLMEASDASSFRKSVINVRFGNVVVWNISRY